MEKSKTKKNQDQVALMSPTQNEKEVEVLYQKLGDRWYAFSCIDDEVFMGSLSDEEVKTLDHQEKKPINHA